MTHPDDLIVMVGRRRGGSQAARRLGLRHLIVDTTESLPDAETILSVGRPAAIVALTEAGVVPAAQLRRRFGLSGLSPSTALRCTDKLEMKQAVTAAGIVCARFIPVTGTVDADQIVGTLGLPLVLKTQSGSGGRGTKVIRSRADLPATVTRACLAESFVDGIEMSVESLVVDGSPVFVNFTEYIEPGWANLIPAVPGAEISELLHDLNRRAIAALGIVRGMTHMEVFLTDRGLVFGELAARPPGGQLMALIELAYGFNPWIALLSIETGQPVELPASTTCSAGTRFFHPGPGVVRATHGVDIIEGLTSVRSVVCKLAPGDVVGPREGTGQHRGYALFAGDADQVRSDLATTRQQLWVEMETGATAS